MLPSYDTAPGNLRELHSRVCELLSSEARWTQCDYASEKSGRRVNPLSSSAEKVCLRGAMLRALGPAASESIFLSRRISTILTDYLKVLFLCPSLVKFREFRGVEVFEPSCASLFNDARTTTHSMILQLLHEAGRLISAGAAEA